jgi:hypothetical protein
MAAWAVGYINQFSSTPTMILHNGTTIFAKTPITHSNEARISLISLPNATVYDADGTQPSAVLVSTSYAIEVEIRVAGWNTIISSWSAHIGKLGTLTLVHFGGGGGSSTCEARLRGPIEDITPEPQMDLGFRRVRLTFVTRTVWV